MGSDEPAAADIQAAVDSLALAPSYPRVVSDAELARLREGFGDETVDIALRTGILRETADPPTWTPNR